MAEHFVKVAFELDQDGDGYPPVRWETLWASPVEQSDVYQIDNIPLFIKGISSGDVVLTHQENGQFLFVRLVQASLNSVFRVYVADEHDISLVRNSFRALGCDSEQSYIPKLFALEVPGTVQIDPVAALLDKGEQAGRWEYEVGVLRHTNQPAV